MKQKDIVLIVIVAFFTGVVSFFVSQAVFTSKNARSLKAEKVDAIQASFNKTDPAVFNTNAINPTKLITIGDSTNPKPF